MRRTWSRTPLSGCCARVILTISAAFFLRSLPKKFEPTHVGCYSLKDFTAFTCGSLFARSLLFAFGCLARPTKGVDARPDAHTVTANESDTKAIVPELPRVKRTISRQYWAYLRISALASKCVWPYASPIHRRESRRPSHDYRPRSHVASRPLRGRVGTRALGHEPACRA